MIEGKLFVRPIYPGTVIITFVPASETVLPGLYRASGRLDAERFIQKTLGHPLIEGEMNRMMKGASKKASITPEQYHEHFWFGPPKRRPRAKRRTSTIIVLPGPVD
jgi:hypothetical protein